MTPADWLTARIAECELAERQCRSRRARAERLWWSSMRQTLERLLGYLDPSTTEPASAIPPDAPSIAVTPLVIEESAPTRATSTRRHPWDDRACTPPEVPGGRRA